MKLTVLAVAFVVAGGFAIQAWGGIVRGGASAEETARIIVHDDKFGIGGRERAIQYGDQIIPLIRKESNNFNTLNRRNFLRIAEVMGSIDTELSRNTLQGLYQRKSDLAVLVGSIGLSTLGAYPEQINEDSHLVRVVRKAESQAHAQLAIIALGYSGSLEALPALHDLLSKRPNNYWHHAYACEALARIRGTSSIPILRSCLQDPDYHALSVAYRAATSLGDKEATGLAIQRVSKDIKGKNSGFLIDELEKVTGKKYGYNKENWEDWWKREGKAWRIPQEFLVTWDKQPE